MPENIDGADSERNPAENGPISPNAPINISPLPEAVVADAPTAAPVDAATEHSTEAAAADIERDAAGRFAESFQEFWEFIRSCAAPSVLSEKWAFLPEHDDLLRIDMSPIEFVKVLEQEYTVEALIDLGLYDRVGDEVRLASWLDGDAPLYVALDQDNRTFGFSRGDKSLFPMMRTALDYALERIPPDSTQAPVTLFIVESQDAVEVMQRLGLRAVSGEGLEALGCHDVERLFSGDQRSDFGWRYYLLLVDFDVARLENRPLAAMDAVIGRLADAEEEYGINPSRRFGVCRPPAHEFRWLERATTFKDTAHIGQVFEKWSAAANSVNVSSWRTYFNSEIPSFSATSAALTLALQQANELTRRVEVVVALPAYRAASRGVVMQMFYKDIDRASDPFDRVDLIAAADYAKTFLDCDQLVRAGEAVLAGQSPPSARELQEELFEQRQRCMVELRRIRRDRKAKR